jgi:hypothetical protein
MDFETLPKKDEMIAVGMASTRYQLWVDPAFLANPEDFGFVRVWLPDGRSAKFIRSQNWTRHTSGSGMN